MVSFKLFNTTSDMADVEKNVSTSSADVVALGSSYDLETNTGIWAKLSQHGVEIRGAKPIPAEERTDTRFFNVFTVFSTSMLSLLP